MRTLVGRPLSPGLADGHAVLLAVPQPVSHTPVQDVGAEVLRFRRAVASAREELQALRNRVHSEFGASEAGIFSAHDAMLGDPVLMDDIVHRIEGDRLSAEEAVRQSVSAYAARLHEARDPYLRERALDIRDIGQRLERQIGGHASRQFAELAPSTIIVATELLPSDLVELNVACLAGVVTERGGGTSHLAILSRALGIPAVTGIANVTALVTSGQQLLLDGDRGELVVEPTYSRLQRFRGQRRRLERRDQILTSNARLPCQTADGTPVTLLANLGRPSEGDDLAAAGVAGIGLLRTEFLFLDHAEPPAVELQQAVYEEVAARSPGETVIRTLDLGGDKFPLFLEHARESNPTLGVRGLRFSLADGEALFREQLRALLGAAARFPIAIMLPMVVGVEDLLAARSLVAEMAADCGATSLPPLGALVETPAAVLLIDAVLEHSDFVGIGTNDLTQFLLAADRNSQDTPVDYSVLHPAVLRAIDRVLQAANARGKPATLCGEAASVPELAALFVGMGVRRLSMSPRTAPRVKHALRQRELEQLRDMATRALAAASTQEVLAQVKEVSN